MRMIATMVAGVALVIVPLLSLTADLLEGLREGSSTDASVEAHHVDELPADVVRDTLVPRLDSLDGDSSSLIFLLCSPQELSENGILRAAMLRCHGRGVLRLVALDEAHLYAQHGTTFRGCIRLLLDQFFRVVFSRTSGRQHPLLLAMSATMTLRLAGYLARLTTIPWTKPRHQLWCSAAEFRRRNIDLDFDLSADIGQVALPKFVAHLRDSPNARVFFFVNHVADCLKWSKKLSELLVIEDVSVFVLEIHGEMDKHEKFTIARLFTNAAHLAFQDNIHFALDAGYVGDRHIGA